MAETRPDPDQLLARVLAAEAKQRRGKLKIFFGAAPGVGKTYAMLEAARKEAKEGLNVLVGYIEPHARPETQALVLGVDVLARRTVTYRGRQLLEFDLAGALAAHPELIIVDELAHTNAVGDNESLVHAKRWQDVEALLAAGINVFSTLNVQHLESLNDVVAKITGVVVRETIPDAVFEQSDEVEFVDLAPDDLIERLGEGKVYVTEQAARAVENFFNKGNLIALRELALRKMAERVDRQMTDYRADRAIAVTWPAAERLLVCVTPGPTSASLVRATRRMAASLRAPWIAVHVETPDDARLRPIDRERLAETLHAARRLGAEVVTLSGTDVTGEIIAYARQRNVTKIIVGKTMQSRWREWMRGSFVYELTRRCGDIDVYVITGGEPSLQRGAPESDRTTLRRGYIAAAAIIAACTALAWALFPYFSAVTLSMIYLAGVVCVAAWHGRGPSILASVLGVMAFDFCFIPPYLTFAVHDTQYLFTFAVMLGTGLLISTLTGRLTFQASLARKREQQAAALSELSRALLGIEQVAHLNRIRSQLEHLLYGDVFVLVSTNEPQRNQSALTPVEITPGILDHHEQAVADWVVQHSQPAGMGTDTLPSVPVLFVPLTTTGSPCGVLGVRARRPAIHVSPDQFRIIETVAGQVALAVQRIRSVEAARQAQLRFEREQLRSALLSAVSHDFRTPLAAIAGAGSTLAESGHALSHESRKELADSIVAETDRLNRLVSNLLDMTRLEAGSMELDREWHPLDDIVATVVRRLSRVLEAHRLTIEVPRSLPLVFLDELLFHQVLVNLLENAALHTPQNSEIRIAAGQCDNGIWLEVADTGLGFSPGDAERIFEKFYQGEHRKVRFGTGLGLAICRGIVELHGGKIHASNRSGGGAVFRIELPQPPQPAIAIPTEAATA
jgi:two-component system sensor histidine kinase KdpD